MNPKNHNRSSSHGRKVAPTHSRPSKPPLLHRRGHSYNHALAQSQSSVSTPRLTLGGARRVLTEVTKQDEDAGDDMAGFLQFCTTCEKQIVTPGNSILYCSEACRRKDVSLPTPPVQTPSTPSASYFDMPPSDIVPQRSPTVLRPPSLAFSDLTLSDIGSPTHDSHSHHDRSQSESATYFTQVQSTTFGSDMASSRRHRANRSSTAFESGLPSLSNTPSSSVGTAGSWSSYRPLPPRHDPSTGHFPTKSVDLVMPSFPTAADSSPAEVVRDSSLKSSSSTMTAFRVAEAGDMSFDRKQTNLRHGDQISGSLKQLLSQQTRKPNAGED